MTADNIREIDPEIYDLIRAEDARQSESLRLIASENYTSSAVLEAVGSTLSNKYSEGYPGRRYYQGQAHTDRIEVLAQERAKDVFGAEHANVQPYSGSPANQAVYMAVCKLGDPVVGLGLPAGGHLSHGWKVNFSGKLYEAHQYGVDKQTELIDLAEVRKLCREVKPKLLSVGTTAYPRHLDWAGFAEVAEEVGAVLFADIAHIAGLVAGGAYPSPIPYAGITTSTTHKTLRGPRGGMILCREEYAKAIDRAVFPGLQGGPHMNQIAGLAVALAEAKTPKFERYAHQVVQNAKAFCQYLAAEGFRIVTGGTDSHLLLVDLTPKNVGGKPYARALEEAGIVCNYNSIPFDPKPPMNPSGIRLGTPALTSRGLKEADFETIAKWMGRVAEAMDDESALATIKAEVSEMTASLPMPGLPADGAIDP